MPAANAMTSNRTEPPRLPVAPAQAGNRQIAQALREMAALLTPFRIAAYRHAADTVAHLPRPVRDLHAGRHVVRGRERECRALNRTTGS